MRAGRNERPPSTAERRETGFSLVELLIAMAITTAAAGTLLSLVLAGQSIARLQPEAADLQQRARIATQVIGAELARAGAGVDAGALAGPLVQRFAPISVSPAGELTIWYVSARGARGTLAAPLAADALAATIALDPPCAGACGFAAQTTAIIFDNSGCHDFARVEDATSSGLVLAAAAPRSCAYPSGAAIAQGEAWTFHVDAAARQLLRRDEATGISVPVSDNVAAMSVEPLDSGRRIRVRLRFVPALLREVPDFEASLDVRPPNLQVP
ncbi:MAG TPA: prepilin-type N-terminal cleavage/methylation domain-containing protein [Vicinamibacterales bacterium]|nr:prepilin-type N-terminal cleavage/methylation domain-containing protein [Vicinamibacterales bacterium]